MIAYFDTSALIPLVVEEDGTEVAERVWEAAERRVAVRLVYPEGRAALAAALREGRLGRAAYRRRVEAFDRLVAHLDVVALDGSLAQRAGELAESRALRGYDAVHLAGAERVAGARTVLVSGDRDLLAAANDLGIAVARTTRAE